MIRRLPVLPSASTFFRRPVTQSKPVRSLPANVAATHSFQFHPHPLRLFSSASQRSNKYFYDLLGVKPGASREDIKKAYYRMAKIYHPDARKTGNHQKFIELNYAYQVLSGTEHPGSDDTSAAHEETYRHSSQQQEQRRHESYSRSRREAEEKINDLMRDAMWDTMAIPMFLLAVVGVLVVVGIALELYGDYKEAQEYERNMQRRLQEQRERELERERLAEEKRIAREQKEEFMRLHPEFKQEYETVRNCHGNGIAMFKSC